MGSVEFGDCGSNTQSLSQEVHVSIKNTAKSGSPSTEFNPSRESSIVVHPYYVQFLMLALYMFKNWLLLESVKVTAVQNVHDFVKKAYINSKHRNVLGL